MSLVYSINVRSESDILNQGLRFSDTGAVGVLTNSTIRTVDSLHSIIVSSFVLTSDSATPIGVTLAFSNGVTTASFFVGYISASSPVNLTYSFGDERYGAQGYNLVITTAAAHVAYTINGRLISGPVPKNYIEHEGASGHTEPWYPPESYIDRAGNY